MVVAIEDLQEPSGALEFDAYKDYMNEHFKEARQAGWSGDFDLAGLEQAFLIGYQKRSLNEFKKDPMFSDNWHMSKRDLERGLWKNTFTLARGNEGVLAHFGGKKIPKSSLERLAGVDVVSWKALLKNYKHKKYLNTARTMNDYATENKKVILGLREAAKLPLDTGKVFRVNGKTVYASLVKIAGEDHVTFSFINQLEVKSLWNRLYDLVY
jgi:hypothetical protein